MESILRQAYNAAWTPEKYEAFKADVNSAFGDPAKFRLCETPVFISNDLKKQLLEACDEINNVIAAPGFKDKTDTAFKNPSVVVPNEDEHTLFLQMDFGICEDGNGGLIPQLIEIQGFPTLYFFQDLLYHSFRKHYGLSDDLTVYFRGLDSPSYIELLRKAIVGNEDPSQVVLLEIEPEKQATSIDFYGTEKYLGIKVLCLSKLRKRGRTLYYIDAHDKEVVVKRIYNRIIFDELEKRPDILSEFSFQDEVDVHWVGHPNWFYRISKHTMPLFSGKYVPECHFLSDVVEYPADLENYVLKPLYSFAGTGVRLHITAADLDAITENRDAFILQRKVTYAPVIDTPTGPAKFEIRMLMLWEEGSPRAQIVNNLIRVSKGEMVGVRYNKDKDWVGASVGFFHKD